MRLRARGRARDLRRRRGRDAVAGPCGLAVLVLGRTLLGGAVAGTIPPRRHDRGILVRLRGTILAGRLGRLIVRRGLARRHRRTIVVGRRGLIVGPSLPCLRLVAHRHACALAALGLDRRRRLIVARHHTSALAALGLNRRRRLIIARHHTSALTALGLSRRRRRLIIARHHTSALSALGLNRRRRLIVARHHARALSVRGRPFAVGAPGHDGRLDGRLPGLGARRGGGDRDRGTRAHRDRRGRCDLAAVTARGGGRHRRAGLGLAQRLLGLGDHARLELLGALGRTAGPVAQALELSRLGEVEQ